MTFLIGTTGIAVAGFVFVLCTVIIIVGFRWIKEINRMKRDK